jgi:diguanylate cyclase (GGDEF)-like protein
MPLPLLAAVLAAGTVLITFVDYLTGPDIGLSLFYLVPVTVGARYLTRTHAIALALLAAAGWLAADAAWHGLSPVSIWNGVTRVGIFLGAAFAVLQLRKDTEAVAQLNARLEALLEQEKRLSRTDLLTGLANARMFEEAYQKSHAVWRRNHEPLAIACLDLDNFKSVNDTRGHAEGDALLKQVAAAATSVLRAGDVAARLGGDEFAVLLHACSADVATRVADRLLQQIRAATQALPDLPLGASIGIAWFDAPPPTLQAALRVADSALYTAKTSGKNRVFLVSGQ